MPFKEPASLHDWHGGPPIIPVTWTGKASDGIFLISPSINFVSGKLALNVGRKYFSNPLNLMSLKKFV